MKGTDDRAFCSSYKCTQTIHASYVEKSGIKRTAVDCPDCGSAIEWKKKKTRFIAKRKFKKGEIDVDGYKIVS